MTPGMGVLFKPRTRLPRSHPKNKTWAALRPGPDLVLGTSSRFVGGDDFVRAKQGDESDLAALGQFVGDGLQILLVKTGGADLHLVAGLNQKNRRDSGQPISIGDWISVGIQNQRERDALFGGEALCCARVVLRDTEDGYTAGAVILVEAFQKGESELANGTGNFEESCDDGASLE